MKRIISLILFTLILSSVFTGVGITVNAEDLTPTYTSGDFVYTVIDNEAEIVDYLGAEKATLEIPAIRGGYTVTGIGANAFAGDDFTNIVIPETVNRIGDSAFCNCQSIVSVSLPDGVKTIGNKSFSDCGDLSTVKFSSSLETIGESAFEYCSSLTNVDLPSSLITIGDSAFQKCSGLQNVTIPEGVTSVGSYAFNNCRYLAEVVLPSTLVSLGNAPFSLCSELKTFVVDENNPAFCVVDGVLLDKNCTKVIQKAPQSTLVFSIPDTVKTICSYAFNYCDYSGDLPKGLTKIESNAMTLSTKTSVTLYESATDIGEDAFKSSDVKRVTLLGADKNFGLDAFNCNVTEVYVDSIENWCSYTFEYDQFYLFGCMSNPLYNANSFYVNGELTTDLVIPEGVAEIKPFSFVSMDSLNSVVIDDAVKSIGIGAFLDCKNLKAVKLGNNVETIGREAFFRVSLTSMYIPDSVTEIGVYGVGYCEIWDRFAKTVVDETFMAYVNDNSYAYNYVANEKINYTVVDESFAGTKMYFNPDDNWQSGNSRFVAKFVDCNGKLNWISMSDENSDGLYEFVVPDGIWVSVSFARMNGNFAENSEDYQLNETEVTSLNSEYNYYSITDSVASVATGEWSTFLFGDVNENNKITISDATEIQRHLANYKILDENQLYRADVNKDGEIDVNDVTYIQKYIVKLIDELPV